MNHVTVFAHRAWLKALKDKGDPVDPKKHEAHERWSEPSMVRQLYNLPETASLDDVETEEDANDFSLPDDDTFESEMSRYQAEFLIAENPQVEDTGEKPPEEVIEGAEAPPIPEPTEDKPTS